MLFIALCPVLTSQNKSENVNKRDQNESKPYPLWKRLILISPEHKRKLAQSSNVTRMFENVARTQPGHIQFDGMFSAGQPLSWLVWPRSGYARWRLRLWLGR